MNGRKHDINVVTAKLRKKGVKIVEEKIKVGNKFMSTGFKVLTIPRNGDVGIKTWGMIDFLMNSLGLLRWTRV